MASADVVIVGQGLAGSCLAWNLHWAGQRVLLIDRNEPSTASRIAAGLLTPVTGQRMAGVPYYRQSFAVATSFYRRIEHELKIDILDVRPSIRLYLSEAERSDYRANSSSFPGTVEQVDNETGDSSGFIMQEAARLNVGEYLKATQSYFSGLGQYAVTGMNLEQDINIDRGTVSVAGAEIATSAVVLCQGWQGVKSRWFPLCPDGPSKGEILRIRLKNRKDDRVVHKGIWLVPEKNAAGAKSYLLGATYNREELNSEPTAEACSELLTGLKQLTDESPEVIDHFAAVRAGMKRRKPVIGQHKEMKSLYIMNGLGSHGSLLAPIASQALSNLIQGRPISTEVSRIIDVLCRGTAKEQRVTQGGKKKSLTQLAHNVIARIVKPGDTVVDATAGNGHDTLKLSSLVGEAGRVIAIDLQSQAISQTSERLTQAGLTAELRQGDHAKELTKLEAAGVRVKAVMFNLGYLPGSDKSIRTSETSTRTALKVASKLLVPGGVITVVAYRGHEGGQEETDSVEEWMKDVSDKEYEITRIEGDTENATSPVLFIIRSNSLH